MYLIFAKSHSKNIGKIIAYNNSKAGYMDNDLLALGKKETKKCMLIIIGYIQQVNKGKSWAWDRISQFAS